MAIRSSLKPIGVELIQGPSRRNSLSEGKKVNYKWEKIGSTVIILKGKEICPNLRKI